MPKSKVAILRTSPGSVLADYHELLNLAGYQQVVDRTADTALKVLVSVLVTLTIYWGAERYARIVAERIHEGHRPSWSTVRQQLTHGWEMVTASALPLTVLAVLTVLGTELYWAVLGALFCSTLLLGVAGWAMGRGGALTTRERIVSATVAGGFGVLFIILKTTLH